MDLDVLVVQCGGHREDEHGIVDGRVDPTDGESVFPKPRSFDRASRTAPVAATGATPGGRS